MIRKVPYILAFFMLSGCGGEGDQRVDRAPGPDFPSELLGRWQLEEVAPELKNAPSLYLSEHLSIEELNLGLHFHRDRLEFMKGFFEKDSFPLEPHHARSYLGCTVEFRVSSDSIFLTPSPSAKEERFFFEIDSLSEGRLLLSEQDSLWRSFKKIPVPAKQKDAFDRILFSRTSCYGPCPVMDVSLKRSGEFLFYGRNYTDTLGLFEGK